MKNTVMECVEALLDAAKQRNTSQGVKIYEIALNQLQAADSDSSVQEILSRLKETLKGIDSHGYYPPKEYELVKKILSLS